jgi:hypothetical protein
MTAVRDTRAVSRIGFWVALCTAAAATVSLATAITTPPRSGPYCRSVCVAYPYTNAAAFVPRDYLWMYPALLTALVFVVLAAYLHDRALPGWRLFTRSALCFAVIGSGTLVADYGIQLTVLQPGLLSGETEGLSPLSQYNPHGLFIGLEDVGYATVNLALLFLGIALVRDGSKLMRGAGWVFSAGGTLTVVVLILYGAIYRASLAYRFEVISLLITWLVLITGGLLLSVVSALAPRVGTPVQEEGAPGRPAGDAGAR